MSRLILGREDRVVDLYPHDCLGLSLACSDDPAVVRIIAQLSSPTLVVRNGAFYEA